MMETNTPSSKTSNLDGFIVLLATIMPAMVFVGLTPILPQIEAHFSGEPGVSFITRLLVSVVGPTVAVGAPIAGLLATRFGERLMLIWATLAFGVAGCTASVLDNIYGILASRVVLGLALAATSTLSMVILTKLYSGETRNRWLGYYGMVGGLATLLLIPLCGFLGAINWRLVFWAHALAFPIALLFALRLPRDHTTTADISVSARVNPSVRGPTPWGLVFLGLACGAISSSPNLYLPFHLASIGVGSPSTIGLLLLPGALASTVSAFGFGAVRRRMSAPATFVLLISIVTAGLLIISLTSHIALIAAGILLMGLGSGMAVPNLFAVASLIGREEDRARLFGLTKGAFFAGPLVSQIVLEPTARFGGPTAPIPAVAVLGMILLVWTWSRMKAGGWASPAVGR